MTVLSTRQHFIYTKHGILAPTKRKIPCVVISWLVKMLGKEAFNISESSSRKFSCVVFQVASLLYVLHHSALHVAFQHIHHSHGDANRGGSAPGASECWGGAWGHQYCRQHHYWRKQANRYLSILAIFFLICLPATRLIDTHYSNAVEVRAVWLVLAKMLVHTLSFCTLIFLQKNGRSFQYVMGQLGLGNYWCWIRACTRVCVW